MTKIASKPAYCASCYQQDPVRYVDFEAAYDGPVIPGAPHVTVDDLIICENCLGSAFALLDPKGKDQTIAELEQVVKDLTAEVQAKDKAIQGFQSTTNELIDHPIKKFPGKPKLEGVSEEVRRLITQGRYERSKPTKPKAKAA